MKKFILMIFLGMFSLVLLSQNAIYKQYDTKTLYVAGTWTSFCTGSADSVIYSIQAGAIWSIQVQPVATAAGDSIYANIKAYVSNRDAPTSSDNIWTPLKGFNDNTTYSAAGVLGDTITRVNNTSAKGNSAWCYNFSGSYWQNVRLKVVISQIAATHKSTVYKLYFVAKLVPVTMSVH
jgi:hypothetical protein